MTAELAALLSVALVLVLSRHLATARRFYTRPATVVARGRRPQG